MSWTEAAIVVRRDGLHKRAQRETITRSLYVIGAPGRSLVKIGIADCPTLRLASLQKAYDPTLMPHDVDRAALRVLHQEPGGRDLELGLHRCFAARRLSGEWFDLGPLAVSLVRSAARDLRRLDKVA